MCLTQALIHGTRDTRCFQAWGTVCFVYLHHETARLAFISQAVWFPQAICLCVRPTHVPVILLDAAPGVLFNQCFHQAPRLLPVADV